MPTMSHLSSELGTLLHQPQRESCLTDKSRDAFSKTTSARPSTSSHESNSNSYKILEPGDFRRIRRHLVLRPSTACSSPLFDSSATSRSANSPLDADSGLSLWGQSQVLSAADRVTRDEMDLTFSPYARTTLKDQDQGWTQDSVAGTALQSVTEARHPDALQVQLSLRSRRCSTASRQRPYTTSSITSTSWSNVSSCQDSCESDRRPLMPRKTHTDAAVPDRPITSRGVIDCPGQEQQKAQLHTRSTSSSRPGTCNLLTAEERRQHIRRAKKLTHILGDELRPSVCQDSRLNRGLMQPMISDGLRSGDGQSDLAQISPKAAIVLGIPHPYAAAAFATKPVFRQASHTSAAAAAVDQKSLTPPMDTGIDASSLHAHAAGVAAFHGELIATIKGDRRRRVAKISRWLGEAVPVELITPIAPWKLGGDNQVDVSDADCHTPWEDVLAHHCSQSEHCGNYALAPHDGHRASSASPLDSFMWVDSSDSEDDRQQPPRAGRAPIVTDLADEGVDTSPIDETETQLEAKTTSSACHAPFDDPLLEQYVNRSQLHLPTLASDRSISKLSNFFGSTPSQIVRSQSDLGNETYLPRVGPGFSDASALLSNRAVLKSLEDEILGESRIKVQNSDTSRRLRLMKKRTTQLFS